MFRTIIDRLSSLTAWWTFALIVLVSFATLLYGAWHDAAIMDELAHIPAGYGYVSQLDYRLNPEHPPLVKVLAGLPLLSENYHFPTESNAWEEEVNGQWVMGAQFLYESGNDANTLLHLARLGPILLTIITILFLYRWGRELLGRWWGILPAGLFALSPHVLAHGHYVTTDVAAAFGATISVYYFLRFLRDHSKDNLFSAAVAFGIAQLGKFSMVLMIPFFVILVLLFAWATETASFSLLVKKCRKLLFSLFLIIATGYVLVVYPTYLLFTFHYPQEKQTSDTELILTSFAGGPTPQDKLCVPLRCLADLNIAMTKNSLTRPIAEYMLGVLMVTQRAAGGNTSYFLGEVSAAGSHLYFPVVYALKEPLAVILMIFGAIAVGIRHLRQNVKSYILQAANRLSSGGKVLGFIRKYLATNFVECTMLLFVLFYWAYSIKSPLNIGFRHLFPSLPFIYFLIAIAWKRWVTIKKIDMNFISPIAALKENMHAITGFGAKYLILLALLVWFVASTLGSAPYFLSYFNALGEGTENGYRYVTDSNYDWGQDLLRLRKWVEEHNRHCTLIETSEPCGINKIAVDYFGGGSPRYELGAQEENWWSARGNPANSGIHWLAVSVNTLQSAIQPLAPGQGRNPEDEYRWLSTLRSPERAEGLNALRATLPGFGNVPTPDYRIGTSIFVYKL